jgi:type II secretory pathway pseudopilin PulG
MNRKHEAGFTMVELTVALVAGLIVALGIVALSKESTTTFHEEVRSSGAEATLRTAVDRLRADLQRAAYMSTPNFVTDPQIAVLVGNANITNIIDQSATGGGGIVRLAGIHLFDGGSNTNTPLSAQQPTPLNPDAIEIGGNMTSTEQFDVQSVTVNGVCNLRLNLSGTSPALYRIGAIGAGGAVNGAALRNIFVPVANNRFMVRLVDDTGRSQYLATCNEAVPANVVAGVPPAAYVDIDPTIAPVLAPKDTGNHGGVNPIPGGRAWINPVQIVRWEITDTGHEPAQYASALGRKSLGDGGMDSTKYDLVRSYVDAGGKVVAASTEVVAEYVVDLNFALSVENGTAALPGELTIAFDDATNQTWADNVFTQPAATCRPQRIRIVRARISTRVEQPDRMANVPVANYGTQAFFFRYCLTATGCGASTSTLQWARARTITTELSLANQAGVFF